jgi:nitrate reductase NapE component
MKITACPRCGSKNLDIADMRDGITPGIDWSTMVCRDCDWQGIPLEFETENAYQKFLKGFEKEKKSEDLPIQKDIAESAPTERLIVRYVIASFLFLLFIIIPLLVYALVSVYGGIPIEIGFLFAGISFLVYLYFFWKKELWNMIKR